MAHILNTLCTLGGGKNDILIHWEEPPQNPNESAKNVLFSWEFLHGWNRN